MSKNYATFESYGNPTLSKESEKSDGEYKSSTNEYIVMEIQSAQHKKKLLTENGIVAVLIHAKWCNPCKVFKPKYANFAKENIDLGLTEGVNAVPSILVYKRGKLFRSIKGGNLNELLDVIPPM
jgi:thiol-disulfide isomerase/thioredoxin